MRGFSLPAVALGGGHEHHDGAPGYCPVGHV